MPISSFESLEKSTSLVRKPASKSVEEPGNTLAGHPAELMLKLQQTCGNRSVERFLAAQRLSRQIDAGPLPVEAQNPAAPFASSDGLVISQPDDASELEADAVAHEVVEHLESRSTPTAPLPLARKSGLARQIHRQASSFPVDAEEKMGQQVQRKSESTVAAPAGLQQRLNERSGSGQVLPEAIRNDMETSFGTNFASVRIHTDGEASALCRSIQAEAFAFGQDVYFGQSKFDPGSRQGKELLAHELTHTLQQSGVQRRAIQCRGGPRVGTLAVNSNVVNAGLTAGHAWLSYQPVGGAATTYGTWGNRVPIGLHRDIELAYAPAATRTTDLDAGDYVNLTTYAAANNDWGYINNCASFAGRGWRTVTGEALSYTNFIGIPNPSSLGAGIVAANGGGPGVLVAGPAAAGGSSSW